MEIMLDHEVIYTDTHVANAEEVLRVLIMLISHERLSDLIQEMGSPKVLH